MGLTSRHAQSSGLFLDSAKRWAERSERRGIAFSAHASTRPLTAPAKRARELTDRAHYQQVSDKRTPQAKLPLE